MRRVVSGLGVLVVALLLSGLAPALPAQGQDPATPADQFNGSAPGHDAANAYLLALISHFVYLNSLDGLPTSGDGPTTDANFEQRFRAWAESLGFTDVTYGQDVGTDTELVTLETDDAVIIAFRGTETMDAQSVGDYVDIVIDILAIPVLGSHAGFLASATNLNALTTVGEALADAEIDGKKVWLTGHSLGGALATVSAWLLHLAGVPVQGLVTYGAPRAFLGPTGVPDIATAFDAAFGVKSQRWVNRLDPIPHIPPSIPLVLPYQHVDVLNNIGVSGDTCTISFDDAEVVLGFTDEQLSTIANLAQNASDALLAGDLPGVVAAAGGIGDVVLSVADLDDHDTKRYASRIHFHLPADVKAAVPLPPYPAPDKQVTECDRPDTPPEVTVEVTGIERNGWYTGDVLVDWTVTEPDNAGLTTSGCADTTITTDTGPSGLEITCTATSQGGTHTKTVTIQRDATPPANVAATPSRDPDRNGWYNAALSVRWNGTDPASGIDSCTTTSYTGPDGTDVSVSGTCTDVAGNVSDPVPFVFDYDATAPVVTIATPPATPADYFLGQVINAAYSCSDALSGVDTCTGPVAAGAAIDTSAFGTHTFTVDATDQAGNTASLSHSYSITYAFSGFSDPVSTDVNEIRAGRVLSFRWNLFDALGNKVENQPELFTAGYGPAFACTDTGTTLIESTDTAGSSGLRWDAETGQYVFNASSSRSDAGYCRYFTLDAGAERSVSALVRFR